MQRVTAVAAAAAAVLAISCGGDSNPAGPTGPTPITITILRQNGAQSFQPNPASAGGQTVVFRNGDSIVHRVRLNDGTLDTGDIAPGATSAALTMPTAGTNYHCSHHTDMIGAVSGTSGTPPECIGPYCGDL